MSVGNNRPNMESENNVTLIDTLALILTMFQLLIHNLQAISVFIATDKDYDTAVETL